MKEALTSSTRDAAKTLMSNFRNVVCGGWSWSWVGLTVVGLVADTMPVDSFKFYEENSVSVQDLPRETKRDSRCSFVAWQALRAVVSR